MPNLPESGSVKRGTRRPAFATPKPLQTPRRFPVSAKDPLLSIVYRNFKFLDQRSWILAYPDVHEQRARDPDHGSRGDSPGGASEDGGRSSSLLRAAGGPRGEPARAADRGTDAAGRRGDGRGDGSSG